MTWAIISLIGAGLLVFIKYTLIVAYGKSSLRGGQLFIITLLFLLSLAAITGAGFSVITFKHEGNTSLMDQTNHLLDENDSLKVELHDLKNEYYLTNQNLQPFSQFAIEKYKSITPEEALQKLTADLPKMEAALKQIRPHLEYLDDSVQLAGLGGMAFYYTTYYFLANNGNLKNVRVEATLDGPIREVTARTRGISPQDEVGSVKYNMDRTSFTFTMKNLPRGHELLVTVRSESMVETKFITWSPK